MKLCAPAGEATRAAANSARDKRTRVCMDASSGIGGKGFVVPGGSRRAPERGGQRQTGAGPRPPGGGGTLAGQVQTFKVHATRTRCEKSPRPLPGSPSNRFTGVSAMSRIDPRTALSRLLAAGTPVSVEPVPLQEAGGRILARSLTADRDHPPADMSAMDGFAVRASDLAGAANPPAAEKRPAPIRLPVTGEARMGQPAEPLPPASAMRISTGAPLPPGSDTVVPVEEVESGPEAIRILHPAAGSVIPGRFV
ncbi:MAG: hypothetical protein EA352_02520, partial [Gemmatimonadales bacterium]